MGRSAASELVGAIMTSSSQLPMDFAAQARSDTTAAVWLGLCLTHRQLFDGLQDEWIKPREAGIGHVLGVRRYATHTDLAEPGNLIITHLQLDPHDLPRVQILVQRAGHWRPCYTDEIEATDEAVFWPGLLPAFSFSSILVERQEEVARLLGMATAVSNVLLPGNVRKLHGDEQKALIEEPAEADSLPRLLLPEAFDSIRGATSMAIWGVPRIAPWLDLLSASLTRDMPRLEHLARKLDAPFWVYPPWFKTSVADTESNSLPLQTRLWLAASEIFREAAQNPMDQSATDIAQAIHDRVQKSALHLDGAALGTWIDQTIRILRGDSALQDSFPTASDIANVGTVIQMVLARPSPTLFRSWLDDLPTVPPAVWWSAAALCGLQSGYRRLDVRFRLKDAAIRRSFAYHALWASNPAQAPVGAQDAERAAVAWRVESGHIVYSWNSYEFTIGAEQARGKWYVASLTDETNRRAAITLARQLRWPCFRREVTVADTELLVDGPGQLSVTDDPVRRLVVNGAVRLILPSTAVFAEEMLDDERFRHLIATAGCPALPAPPATPAARPMLPTQVVQPVKRPLAAESQTAHGPVTIPGLLYIPDFLSEADESELLATIDSLPWLNELTRRVQHYGFRYEYKARRVDPSMSLGPLPPWAARLAERLQSEGRLPHLANQVIVNEYVKDQGIAKHIDCEPCFADGIAMVSLGESWEMLFTEQSAPRHKVALLLERRSVAILTGEARYRWLHEIPKRKIEPSGMTRGRRVSVTFRFVQVSDKSKQGRGRRILQAPLIAVTKA